MPEASFDLAPSQQHALDELLRVVGPGRGAVLHAGDGNGKTSILRAAHARLGGAWIGATELQEALSTKHPLAMEDAFYELVVRGLAESTFVFVDDSQLLLRVLEHAHMYQRVGLADLGTKSLAQRASPPGRRSSWQPR